VKELALLARWRLSVCLAACYIECFSGVVFVCYYLFVKLTNKISMLFRHDSWRTRRFRRG